MITKAAKASSREEILKMLSPTVREWYSKFEEPTPPQQYAVRFIKQDKSVLVTAPTGSGKTLTGFLTVLDELYKLADDKKLEDKVYAIYVSPLRALAADIEKNLNEPLDEMTEIAKKNGTEPAKIRVAVRTGDTTQSERAKMLAKPPHILITTPESLALLLNSPKFLLHLSTVKWMIIDEIHELCSNKRGVHFSLSLERLQGTLDHALVRIGLSATIHPLEEVAKYLVGYENGDARDCVIADAHYAKKIQLELRSPAPDLVYISQDELNKKTYRALDALIRSHKTTLVFTNTRSGTERVVHHLKTMFPTYGQEIGAHHGSLSRAERERIENALKKGELKAVVCSTSLELGIDIGYVDLVVQLASPKSVTRCLQRIGRSGHKYMATAKGILLAQDRDDLVEIAVMLHAARKGKLDAIQIPKNALDVLAQHVLGMALEKQWNTDDALELVRKSYCYSALSKSDFIDTLKYLAGNMERYHVYGKIYFDEERGVFGKRGKLARLIYSTNIGTIPEQVSMFVNLLPLGYHVGNIEEEFLNNLNKGDRFVLGGKVYEYCYTKGMQCYVKNAEGAPTVPSWFSEMLPLSFDLANAIAGFREELHNRLKHEKLPKVSEWVMQEFHTDEDAAKAIISYIEEEAKFLELMKAPYPSRKNILVEEYFEPRKKHYIVHALTGRRVTEVLSKVLASRVSEKIGESCALTFNDNGFEITVPRSVKIDIAKELASIKNLRKEAEDSLAKSEALKRRFRHVASRALMILRNYKGVHKSVGRQQLSAHILLSVVKKIPNFPVLKEAYREVLEDYMDLYHAQEFLNDLHTGDRKIVQLPAYDLPSPFAFNLLTQGLGDVIMLQDKRMILQNLHTAVTKRLQSRGVLAA
ncbi:MAG TPA: ATP-dependent helicase [Candidatus Norongarragalinales archaeon]|jgi:ATP-dependent Lhr-like helicase|nr:ATP-dependent helicase [Candidatus Norongarragalinales archaeon]